MLQQPAMIQRRLVRAHGVDHPNGCRAPRASRHR